LHCEKPLWTSLLLPGLGGAARSFFSAQKKGGGIRAQFDIPNGLKIILNLAVQAIAQGKKPTLREKKKSSSPGNVADKLNCSGGRRAERGTCGVASLDRDWSIQLGEVGPFF